MVVREPRWDARRTQERERAADSGGSGCDLRGRRESERNLKNARRRPASGRGRQRAPGPAQVGCALRPRDRPDLPPRPADPGPTAAPRTRTPAGSLPRDGGESGSGLRRVLRGSLCLSCHLLGEPQLTSYLFPAPRGGIQGRLSAPASGPSWVGVGGEGSPRPCRCGLSAGCCVRGRWVGRAGRALWLPLGAWEGTRDGAFRSLIAAEGVRACDGREVGLPRLRIRPGEARCSPAQKVAERKPGLEPGVEGAARAPGSLPGCGWDRIPPHFTPGGPSAHPGRQPGTRNALVPSVSRSFRDHIT